MGAGPLLRKSLSRRHIMPVAARPRGHPLSDRLTLMVRRTSIFTVKPPLTRCGWARRRRKREGLLPIDAALRGFDDQTMRKNRRIIAYRIATGQGLGRGMR